MGVKSTFELASVDEEVHAILRENTTNMISVLKELLKKLRKRVRSTRNEIPQCWRPL